MWPENVRCAVSFTFDFDAESVWLSAMPENAKRHGALSQGRFGRAAIPMILSLLKRKSIQSTFFIPGMIAESYPDSVRAIFEGGHELAVHGYTHTSPTDLSPEDEEDHLVRAKRILENFGGQVVGYRSPSFDVSDFTFNFLAKHGFLYSSNMMDDLYPYRHHGTRIIELPVHWILDDAPHFWFDDSNWTKKISTPREVREIWDAEFEGFYELGGAFILTMHPQIIGRPHRLKMLEDFIDFVASHPKLWVAPCAQIAEHISGTCR